MDLFTADCNWGNLMNILNEEVIERNAEQESIVISIHDTLQKRQLPDFIIHYWYTILTNLACKITVNFAKKVLQPKDLKIRAGEIYKEILQMCSTDGELLRIKNLIDNGPELAKKVSGRTIDTLVTRFPRYNNVCYHLDVTNPKKPSIIQEKDITPDKVITLFDIGSSYRHKMHQYSKTYFDCFGRGDEVEHTLTCGTKIRISICQFTFFIWADRFKVFEFLDQEYLKIVVVRQHSQKNTYKPKRKRKRKHVVKMIKSQIKCTMLNPKVSHGRTRKGNVVLMDANDKNVQDKFNYKKQMVPQLRLFYK
jgi:hypothetical protein